MLISAAGQINHTNSIIPKGTLEIDFTWPPSDLNTRFRRFGFLFLLQETRVLRASSSDNTRGADKSLARTWKETSYSDQDLQDHTNTCGVQTTAIYSCCLYAVSLGIVL